MPELIAIIALTVVYSRLADRPVDEPCGCSDVEPETFAFAIYITADELQAWHRAHIRARRFAKQATCGHKVFVVRGDESGARCACCEMTDKQKWTVDELLN